MSPRDGDTLAKLAARNEAGLRQLLEDHGRGMLALLRRLFGVAVDREDVLYRTVLKVWQSFSTYQSSEGTLRRWFWGIARNEALKRIRAERRWERSHRLGWDMDGFVASAPGVEYSAKDREYVRDLRRCLSRLAPQQLEITISDIESRGQLTARELAEAMDTSEDTIYAARSQARAKLRRCIEERQRQRSLERLRARMQDEGES